MYRLNWYAHVNEQPMTGQAASRIHPDRSDFVFRSGRLCLDLVATLGSRRRLNIERLRRPEDVDRWFVQAGLTREPAGCTEQDLRSVTALREAIYEAVMSNPPTPAAVSAINRWAEETPLTPVLDAGARAVTWAEGASLPKALSTIARDAADLMSNPQLMARIRECAGPECTLLFLDSSRPGKRRWCSMDDCGNQAKSAGLREKRRAERHLGKAGLEHTRGGR